MQILYVEDSADDALLLQLAIQRTGLLVQSRHATDGQNALRMLDSGSPPDLVLCDVRMPGMSGLDLLGEIKTREGLDQTPVVMLTSSDEERDITRAAKLGASGYVVKPGNLNGLEELIRNLHLCWKERKELEMWPRSSASDQKKKER